MMCAIFPQRTRGRNRSAWRAWIRVVSAPATDWAVWHDAYSDPASSLSRRLRIVQHEIRRALPARPHKPFRVLSLCAGRGDDLIGALGGYAHAGMVRARLIERDPRNVRALAGSARAARLELEIVLGDAADPHLYAGAAPADLVLLCGVLGNISDADVRATVGAMPELCQTGGTVIWTRSRRAPDATPRVRRWFAEEGFDEVAFIAPQDELFSVGVHRFGRASRPLRSSRLFRFVS
jgi:hypothetical protein